MSRPYPENPFLRNHWEPFRMEGDALDLVVEGEMPRDLAGALYRNGPNQRFAPRGDRYHPFGGDGMVHAFFFRDGRVDYRNRWVRTERYVLEDRAGESLFAGFGGESDPAVQGASGNTANTNVLWHAGRLLALWEAGPPYRLDPETLATLGPWNFEGALTRAIDPETAEAMGIRAPDGRVDANLTAHPKIDPESGEMLAFGYSPLPPFVTYRTVSPDGRLVRSVDVDAPYPSMMHDFVTTRQRVVFPVFPAAFRIERLAQGGNFLAWEPDLGTRIGVMPRDGGNDDVVWFAMDPCYVFHFFNAHDDGDRVVVDAAQYPVVPIPAEGQPEFFSATPVLVRWTLDLASGGVKQEALDDLPVEFPRLDERRAGLPYRYGYGACARPGEEDVGGFGAVVRYDLTSGARTLHDFGAGNVVSEPVFVPRAPDAPEGDGWLLVVVYRGDERRSDLAVLDAGALDAAPVAVARLPHRVPAGFHGNWRDLR